MTKLTPKISAEQIKTAEKQIRKLQSEVKYDLRDFVIGYLVEQFQNDVFYIPDYQREFIWRDHHRWRFIESVILGLPIPMMFVAEIEHDGRLEVVDGAQRIQTLEAFLNNDLKLTSLEILTELNGFKFENLPKSQQNKFRNKAMRIVVLDDSTTISTRKEIFNRINTSGEKAKPSEVRRGIYEGPFMDFIEECTELRLFKKLCPVSEPYRLRREPHELILRFFAYSDRYLKFKHNVESFLDEYVEDHKTEFDKAQMKKEFDLMLEFVDKHFPHGFAKSTTATTTPRVRFEAIAVGVNLALRKNSKIVPSNFDWLNSIEFKENTTSHATNSRPKLKRRIEYVRDMILGNS